MKSLISMSTLNFQIITFSKVLNGQNVGKEEIKSQGDFMLLLLMMYNDSTFVCFFMKKAPKLVLDLPFLQWSVA